MAELKISDLSVGDWIQIDEGSTPVSIKSIHSGSGQDYVIVNDNFYDEGIIVFAYAVKPIPITPEILEKNGFEKREGCLWYNPHIKCGCYRFGSTYWDIRIKYKNRGYRPTRIAIDNILHIHQLQHALRLAGIEKEIEV